MKCIPKVAAAHRPTAWCSLSLVSVLQKWYMTTAACAISRILPPWTCDMYGFFPGKQTGEVTGAIRLLFQKADQWGIPLAVVKKAVGNIEHCLLDVALAGKGVPLCLRAAVLRELSGVTLDTRLQDIRVSGVALGKGGKQGCSSTPLLWNIVLDHVFGCVIDSGRTGDSSTSSNRETPSRLGVDLGDGGIPSPAPCGRTTISLLPIRSKTPQG